MRVFALTLATALLCVVPFWLAPVVPTTDGPAHLYNAWLLLDLDDPGLQAGRFLPWPRVVTVSLGFGLRFFVHLAGAVLFAGIWMLLCVALDNYEAFLVGGFPLSFRPEGMALASAWRDGGVLPPGAVAVRFE